MPKMPKKIKDMSHADMWEYGWAMRNADVPYPKMLKILRKWERKTGQKWNSDDK